MQCVQLWSDAAVRGKIFLLDTHHNSFCVLLYHFSLQGWQIDLSLCHLSVITHSDPHRGPREFNYLWARKTRTQHTSPPWLLSSFCHKFGSLTFFHTELIWIIFRLHLSRGFMQQTFHLLLGWSGRGGSCVTDECREGVRPTVCESGLRLSSKKNNVRRHSFDKLLQRSLFK